MVKQGINLNVAAAAEHVPDIKRQIRVIKERVRALWHKLPYNKKPKALIIALVQHVIQWLNNFPPNGGISEIYSPRTIMTGQKFDYNKHCRVEIGAYAQVHEETNPKNSMKPKTIGAIALGATGNIQGSYKF
jgi:hypothetical protein